LLDLHQAYSLADEGDELAGKGDHGAAADRYRQAAALAPHSDELLFWAGLSLAQGGEVDEGAAAVQGAIDAHQGWRELLLRLDEEIAPSAESVRRALGS
jgi:predicted TPR repeat methyltransferase